MRLKLVWLASGLLASSTLNAERFTNATVGLTIQKPADWFVLSAEAVAQDHRTFETANPELRGQIADESYTPVFAFARDAGSHRGLACTIKVGMRPSSPSEAHSGQKHLQTVLRQMRSLAQDLKVVTAPEVVTLAGTRAGHMSVIFTLKANGETYRVASDGWAIPHGKQFIEVGATYPVDDQRGDRAASMKVVRSLQLTN
jgi:hypothetical protein